jgi:hypothetical protein
MGDLIESQFNTDGPVAKCPNCGDTRWFIRLNGFEQNWDKIIGTECFYCGFLIDWMKAER